MHAKYIHTPTSTRDCRHRRPSFFDIFMAHGGDKICWESKLRCREKAKALHSKMLLYNPVLKRDRSDREGKKQTDDEEGKEEERRRRARRAFGCYLESVIK